MNTFSRQLRLLTSAGIALSIAQVAHAQSEPAVDRSDTPAASPAGQAGEDSAQAGDISVTARRVDLT